MLLNVRRIYLFIQSLRLIMREGRLDGGTASIAKIQSKKRGDMNKIHTRVGFYSMFVTLIIGLGVTGYSGVLFAQTPAHVMYTVSEGDTLEGIAHRLLKKVDDWKALVDLNKISDPMLLPVDTKLRIPVNLLKPIPLEATTVAPVGVVIVDGVLIDKQPIALTAGSHIQTGQNGKVSVKMPDGSRLRIGPDADVRVETLQTYAHTPSQDVNLVLKKGRVESEVASQRGPAARYRITTPTGVIGVRGTVFRVAAAEDSGDSIAEVAKGEVAVAGGGASKNLQTGYALKLERGRPLGVPLTMPLSPDVKNLPNVVTTPIVRFTLPPLNLGERYRAVISRASNEDEIFVNEVLGGVILRATELEDGQYVLRLRKIGASGIEGLDAEHAFRLAARPEAPFLLGPQENGKVSEGAVRFVWAYVDGVESYHVQVSDQEDFSSLLGEKKAVTVNETELDLPVGAYFWRVASVRSDGFQGPWSVASRIQVRPLPGLAQEPLADNGMLTLRWAGEPGVKYDYEFASDSKFMDILAKGSLEKAEFSIPLPAPEGYYLRLRSIEPDGFVSPWTQPQRVYVPAGFPWGFLIVLLAVF